MTPKEKAFELAHKFRLIDFRTSESTTMMISMADAKQCALIAVDEIIESSPLDPNNTPEWLQPEDWFSDANISAEKYWIEVKKEIEAL